MTTLTEAPDVRASLQYPLEGPGGRNAFLAGAGLLILGNFIPLVPHLLVFGYLVRILRRVTAGERPGMPGWDHWSELLQDGVKAALTSLLFLGPGVVAFMGGMTVYMITWLGGIAILQSRPESEVGFLPFGVMLAAMTILFVSMALSWILTVLGALPLPMALSHAVARRRFSAAFAIGDWGRLIRTQRWNYFLAWVVTLGVLAMAYLAWMILYLIPIVCFFLGFALAPVTFYLMLVAVGSFGQVYARAVPTPAASAVPIPATVDPAPESAPLATVSDAPAAAAESAPPAMVNDALAAVDGAAASHAAMSDAPATTAESTPPAAATVEPAAGEATPVARPATPVSAASDVPPAAELPPADPA